MAGIVGSKAARAYGGTVSTVGGYTLHTFTAGSSSFTPATTGFIDILLVGGGGNGARVNPGQGGNTGGGGAGATLFKKMIPVVAGTPYPVSIGGATAPTTFTYSGITTTASGGGTGGPEGPTPAPNASGGGGGSGSPGGTGAGVLGIGFPGGQGAPGGGMGGGGGGAGGNGIGGNGSPQGAGGPGVPITYFTGVSPNIVSVGGPGFPSGVTDPSYGSGGQRFPGPTASPLPASNSGKPGVAYIRYI